MAFPLATAVRVAVSINRLTSAVGATIFVIAGIIQMLYQTNQRRKNRKRTS